MAPKNSNTPQMSGIKIISVTSGNIDKANKLLTKGHATVEFFHPNCGHCQTLKPEWEKMCFQLKKNYKGNATIAAIDCSDQEMLDKLTIDKNFQGFPTILHMINGKSAGGGEYQGDRTSADLLKFAENKLPISRQEEKLQPATVFKGGAKKSTKRRRGRRTNKRRTNKRRTNKRRRQCKNKKIGFKLSKLFTI